MRARRSTLVIGMMTALMGSAVHAEGPQTQLIEQGQYWQTRGNTARASEAWLKVLQLDKGQVDALYGMGFISIQLKNIKQANEYLARLQALSPVPWQAQQLQQDIALTRPENIALLNEARRLADTGENDKAIDTYRKMFNGLSPQGVIGREYYNNLAFTEKGWSEARKGMERLLSETPNDSMLALFYGKQLARHEDSRVDGARVLSRLTKHEDIAGAADESWRLALVWMGPPSPAQYPLFEEFLKAHPDDQQIREQLAKGRQRNTFGSQPTIIGRGMQALEKGDLQEAEKAFQERLSQHPDDIDAMGGMGVIRLQQNKFAEADQLLGRAVGKGGSQWKSAQTSARYWLLIQQGRDLQAKGQTAQAQDVFAQAVRLDPKNLDGRVTIADVQANAGQFEVATAGYRQVLSMQAGNPPAMRGLVNVLSLTGHADEALRLLDSLTPAEQAKFGDQARMRALRAKQKAGLAEQRGDLIGAQAALNEAIESDPDNVWMTFDLARLLIKSGDQQKARETIDSFVRLHRDNADALYASALLSVELEQWEDALETINRIPEKRRTVAMNETAAQITLTTQVKRALALSKSGQRQEALALLDRQQSLAAGNPEHVGILASAYVDAGDPQRAMSMIQPLVAPGKSPSINLRLQYASILLRIGDDAQVYSVLTALQGLQMSTTTRKQYDDLRYQYRVRQAERLRAGGDLAAAYDTLAPALIQRPGDVDATTALARMFIAAGDNARALDLIKPLVQRNPLDSTVLLTAADTAVLARDNAYATAALEQFVKLQSTDPTALTDAARIYRTMGKTTEATALLRKAVAIENSAKQRLYASQPGGVDPAVNPFRSQGRQLAVESASAIPPPAEATLQRVALVAPAAASGDVLPAPANATRRTQQTAAPAYAPAYAAAPAASAYQAQPYVQAGGPVYAAADYPVATQPQPQPQPQRQSAGGTAAVSAEQRALFAQRVNQQALQPGLAEPVDNLTPAQRALNDILQSRSAYVSQGVVVRGNASEGGLSQLNDIEAPLEVSMPMGNGRVAVRVTPVALNAGSMTDEASARFGSGASSATGVGTQRANGVGLGVAYETADAGVKADIGTTPMGFQYANVVGGVSVSQPFEGSSSARYSVALSRRALTDSLVSFAGTTDRRDGSAWGGVTANGGRAELSYDDDLTGIYTYGALHSLQGHNVASNTRVELGAGAYRYLENRPNEKLTAGLSATVISYANNQNYFTYGNGGYFSPQAFLGLGVPVTWAKRSDNFTFQLKGSLGMQYFQQDAADYFPTDSARQTASGLRYAQLSKTGLGYSLEGSGEYRFGSRMFVGGTLRMNNSSDFRELNVAMYLRYTFEDMQGRFMTLPVSPYRSPYSN